VPRAQSVSITGSVLRWAREASGFSEDELARKLGVSSEQVRAWEENRESPNRTEFAALVRLLRRPSSVFFLPEPPKVAAVQAQFRRRAGTYAERTNREEAHWIRVAARLQEVASWAISELQLESAHLPKVSASADPDVTGSKERLRFDVPIGDQISWATPEAAFRQWRLAVESKGIIVLLLRLGKESCRGFSLSDVHAPLIAINSAYNAAARIFTLFHEYGHLLTGTSSICPAWIDEVAEDVERWHERFSAAFLLPAEDFLEAANKARQRRELADLELVRYLAGRFNVSLRAVAVRLIELGAADRALYELVAERATVADFSKAGRGGKGLKKVERRFQEFGYLLPRLLLSAKEREVLRLHEILDFLDVGAGDLRRMGELLRPRR